MTFEHLERSAYRGPRIQEGNDAETAILGRVASASDRFMRFDEAIQFVRNAKQVPPTLPHLADLRRRVASQLGLQPHQIRYYSAVGSPLDKYHGVDAILEANGRFATLDVTLRPEKTHSKSDATLLLQRRHDGGYEPDPTSLDETVRVLSAKLSGTRRAH